MSYSNNKDIVAFLNIPGNIQQCERMQESWRLNRAVCPEHHFYRKIFEKKNFAFFSLFKRICHMNILVSIFAHVQFFYVNQ